MLNPRLAAALPLMLLGTAVSAADLPARTAPVPAPIIAPAPVADWGGFYAGSLYGIGIGSFNSSQAASAGFTKTGQTGGGLIGYNVQTGNFVYGIEGDITLDLIRGHNAGNAGLIAHDADTLYTARLRGRFGYDLGAFMPYVAAGVAFNETYLSNGANGAPLDFGQVRRRTGLTLGAGLDYRFMAPFFGPMVLRGEYVYDTYGSRNFTAGDPNQPGAVVSEKQHTQYFRIGLIYRPGDHWQPPATSAGVVDWSGAYAGLIGGGLFVHAPTTLAGQPLTTTNASGPAFGIYMGRNFQFGALVLGFDSTATLTNATGTGSLPGQPAGSLSYRNYIQADLRGRIGYAIDRFLPFFAAGASFGRSEQKDPLTGSERGRIPTETWTVGGGVDYMINDRFSMRAEYLYERDMKNRDIQLNGVDYSQKRSAQTVRLGIAYHFH